jgi:hypothetical protein
MGLIGDNDNIHDRSHSFDLSKNLKRISDMGHEIMKPIERGKVIAG